MTFKIGGLYEFARSDHWNVRYGIYPDQTIFVSATNHLRLMNKFVLIGQEETEFTRVLEILVAGDGVRGFIYHRKQNDWFFQEILTVEDKPDGNSV